MMATITASTGLNSGLDIKAIVGVIIDTEKAAKQNQITKQTSVTKGASDGVDQLTAALSAFQTAMTALKSTTTPAFQGFAATSANESVVKATAGNAAVSGTYSLNVSQLATSSKVATAALSASQTSAIPSGTLKITQNGTTHEVKITSASSTLQQVRDTINSSLQGKGITANIITDGNGSRLVYSSTTTGKGSDISVNGGTELSMLSVDGTKLMSTTSTSNDANGNPIPGAGAISDFARDAEFTIDGLKITSATNTVSNAVSGLTFELVAKSASNTADTAITVATNTEGLKTSLQTFVDSYNTLAKLVTTLTKGTVSADGKSFTAAAMTGDSTPRALLAVVRNQIATATSSSGLGSLAQLGITTQQKDGTLALNTTAFTTALNDKKFGGEIQQLFTGSGGLIERMEKSLEPYTKSGGILATKKTMLTQVQTRLSAEQEALDRRIETLTNTLTTKYNAMDLAVGKLKATATSITSIFEAMNAQKNAS
ncbi:flagellar filament capping protein FliD [Pseudomonas cichorii]|uniref:flagellar filament capping protein FliD n=1 Tax=Pseudomonas cichorii TaxID=36746 RepID=UPI001C88F2FE|nr:flagellar filament capping protein FliD [Pseudomonas cichorii]MBX8483942.1 flagellar filament capping protein FliD [Pseudomonas cichorii]